MELADLIQPQFGAAGGSTGEPARSCFGACETCEPESLVVRLRNSNVELIDEPSHTRLHLQVEEGNGLCEGRRITIENLAGTVNGGSFRLAGQVDSSGPFPMADATLKAEQVAIDDGMTFLRYVVPPLAGVALNVKGRLRADVYLQGRGSNWDAFGRSLVGQGVVALESINLEGGQFLSELAKLGKLPRKDQLATVHSELQVKERRIITERSEIQIGTVPLTMSGSTDFDGRINYRIKLDRLTSGLSDRARRFLSDLDVDLSRLATLTLSGTVDRMVLQLSGPSVDQNALRDNGMQPQEREKLKMIGRQLRDKLLR
jgi:AsmA protein